VSLDQLRKVIGSSRETVESMLRALVRARQVVVVKVGGELVYRVTM
jgi:predicted transcriptional regulator